MTTEQLDTTAAEDTAPAARRLTGTARAAANREPLPPPRPVVAEDRPSGVDDGMTTAWDLITRTPVTPQPGQLAVVAAPEKPAPATWGRRRTVIRVLSLGLARPAAGAEELAYRRDLETIRTTRWPRSVRIAVANPKGGSGKTPTALILGGMIAEQGRPVAVWDASDASDARGTLTERAEGAPAGCVSRVEEAPGEYRTPGTIGAIPARQSSFAEVFGSLTDREFAADSVDRVTWALDRTYQVQVADTGNVPHSSAFEQTISLADMLVVPVTVTAGSVNKAVALLERLQSRDSGLTAGAVVAVTRYGGPETPGLLERIPGIFAAVGVGSVVDIPFDPVIARGTTIDTHALSRASRLAWTRLAAAAVFNITTTGSASA